jgi:putative endonuclease
MIQAKVAHRSASREGGPSIAQNELRLASHPCSSSAIAAAAKVAGWQAVVVIISFQNLRSDTDEESERSACEALARPALFPQFHGCEGVAIQLHTPRMPTPKSRVYVIRSLAAPSRYYTGVTSHVRSRLADHNAGRCAHTASGRPWALDFVAMFADEGRAVKFERYLKTVRPRLTFILVNHVPDARFGQHCDGMTVLLQGSFDLMHAREAVGRAVPEPRDSAGCAPVKALRF